ncbi:MAG: tellurium resistance protein TerC [Phenylobacterium zucineum]|nr:MAG: tellurium resistance protein TerC [Phenylobacterium zucineum]
MFEELFAPGAFSALLQVLMIDLVLAGDNAVAVGLAAGGLPPEQRRKAIFWGLGAAVITRIAFALITTQLLGIVGLLFAGGLLLLWVCWKMWRELRDQAVHEEVAANAALDSDPTTEPKVKPKTFKQALIQILIADVSMSLDNVLAVAGAARDHEGVMVIGLLLSIALMGVAAHAIARLLHRYRWIGYIGLLIVLYVALHMMWQGYRDVVTDLGYTSQYNAAVPDFLDIQPKLPAPAPAH